MAKSEVLVRCSMMFCPWSGAFKSAKEAATKEREHWEKYHA